MSTTSPEAAWPRPLRTKRRITLERTAFRDWAPLTVLLVLTGALYLWALTRNGYANQYYAAAVQAGTHSWKSFLFGSLDAANYITVDKPPASLWLMELSSRVFGFSSFSMLLPQALEGVAAVAILYATVKRWFGRNAALLSGLILALTPVAALMFRFNNPDALLVLLLIAAAYAVTRALEKGSTRWLVLAGALIGFGFLTKMMEAFLVLPAFALVYLVAAPVPMRRRIWQLALVGAAIVVAAGWWVALVEIWPASARPYVGGSTDNSILQLIFGYNGIDRISSAGAPANFGGSPGIFRLFNSEMGGQISWLLPASAIALVSGLVWTRRRARTDRERAALLLWGGWLVVVGAVFSFMSGTIHPYYTNLLAPAIAVLVGVGGVVLWRHRERLGPRLLVASMLAATAVWSYVLLDRTPTWHPWLRYVILIAALGAATVIIVRGAQLGRGAVASLAAVALLASLAGPAAYTLSTVATPQSGSNVSAGPALASVGSFGGAGGPAGGAAGSGHATGGGLGTSSTSRALASLLEQNSSQYTWIAATSSAQNASSIELATGKSVMALGGFTGSDPAITLARFEQLVAQGKIHYFVAGGFGGGGGGRAFGGGTGATGGRGFGGGAGAPGGQAPGGGSGSFRPQSGGAPGGGAPGGIGTGGGQATISKIESWVSSHFKSQAVDGTTVYNLTQPKAS